MSTRLLLDRNVDARLGPLLEAEGYDVTIVGRDYPGTTPDEAIVDVAIAEGRIVLTEDLGFGERIVRHAAPNPGVVLFRLKPVSLQERFSLTMRALLAAPRLTGRLVVISRSGVRIRR